jgi:MFS family permease
VTRDSIGSLLTRSSTHHQHPEVSPGRSISATRYPSRQTGRRHRTQFLQEIQHYSPLRTGFAFLPIPVSVFLTSRFYSRVLVGRVPGRILMMAGTALAGSGLVLASFISAGTPYPQVVVSLVMFGMGSGLAFISMTTAGLTDVAPADAGAASGLINVTQQLGAALGLAVLVTVFDAVVGESSVSSFAPATAAARSAIVHGLDVALLAGAGFALTAFLIVTFLIRRPSASVAVDTVGVDDDLDASLALEEALDPEMDMGA